MLEEEEQRLRRRSPSPAFRSTSPRFGASSGRGQRDASFYDRGSYLRPTVSAAHDFYVPPGMGDVVRTSSRSPARVSMASRTPRFQPMVAHGTGMCCPVLTASERVVGHMPS